MRTLLRSYRALSSPARSCSMRDACALTCLSRSLRADSAARAYLTVEMTSYNQRNGQPTLDAREAVEDTFATPVDGGGKRHEVCWVSFDSRFRMLES